MKDTSGKGKATTTTVKVLSIVAAIAICTTVALLVILLARPQEATDGTDPGIVSLYIAMNPTIRIDIDTEGRVLDIQAYSDDARPIVEGFSAANGSLSEFIAALTDRAINLGIIDTAATVTINVSTLRTEDYSTVLDILEDLNTSNPDPSAVVYEIRRIAPELAPTPDMEPRPTPAPTPDISPGTTPRPR